MDHNGILFKTNLYKGDAAIPILTGEKRKRIKIYLFRILLSRFLAESSDEMDKCIVFLIGAVGYSLLEIAWRGYTHWTMTVTGGACFLVIYYISALFGGQSLLLQCFLGAAAITLIELAVGCVVNLALGWNVWDYSGLRFHLFGQVSLLYSVFWFFLCIPLLPFCSFLRQYLT